MYVERKQWDVGGRADETSVTVSKIAACNDFREQSVAFSRVLFLCETRQDGRLILNSVTNDIHTSREGEMRLWWKAEMKSAAVIIPACKYSVLGVGVGLLINRRNINLYAGQAPLMYTQYNKFYLIYTDSKCT